MWQPGNQIIVGYHETAPHMAIKPYKNHIATILVPVFLIPVYPARAADAASEAVEMRERETTNDENTGQPENPAAESENTINRYRALIQQMETDHGVYHPEIAEALLSLGLAYKAQNNQNEATNSFKRAMQISRVNHGLHSLDQVPYLEFLIQGNWALKSWEELNDNYHYLYWLYKRNYGDNDPRLLPIIDRVTQSQVEIFNSNPDLFTAEALRDREKMLNKAVDIIETNFGKNDTRLIKAYNQLALTNYYMALQTGYFNQYRKYHQMLDRAGPRELTTRTLVPVAVVNGKVVYQSVEIPDTRHGAYLKPEVSRKFDLIKNTEINGKLALKQIKKIHDENPELSLYSRALALTHEGDWRLLYESGKGMKQYREAHELLNQTTNGSEYINQLFGQPRPIPAFLSETEEILTQPTEIEEEYPERAYLELSYDVTPIGRVVNVEIISQSPDLDESMVKQIKRYVLNRRYRPRFENAKPVMTKDIKVKYSVDPKNQLMAEVK